MEYYRGFCGVSAFGQCEVEVEKMELLEMVRGAIQDVKRFRAVSMSRAIVY